VVDVTTQGRDAELRVARGDGERLHESDAPVLGEVGGERLHQLFGGVSSVFVVRLPELADERERLVDDAAQGKRLCAERRERRERLCGGEWRVAAFESAPGAEQMRF